MIDLTEVYRSTFYGRKIEVGYSDHHEYEFVHNDKYGRCLFLDGILQSTRSDQGRFNDGMVRFALEYNDEPRHVLIVGGAGGGTLHSLLKGASESIRSIQIVDIDETLFGISRRLMSGWNDGELDDERVTIAYANGADFLKERPREYDLVLLDVSDPVEYTKSNDLYCKDVYRAISDVLVDRGVVAFHAAEILATSNPLFTCFNESLAPDLNEYSCRKVAIDSFEMEWRFSVIRKNPEGQ